MSRTTIQELPVFINVAVDFELVWSPMTLFSLHGHNLYQLLTYIGTHMA